MKNKKEQVAKFLLRIGIAFAFIYPAVAGFFEPLSWIGFFPKFILDLPIQDELLLHIFGATELVIGLWILIGRKVFIPCILASLYLVGIVLFNIPLMDIVFRDVSILAMTIALALLEKQKQSIPALQQTPEEQ